MNERGMEFLGFNACFVVVVVLYSVVNWLDWFVLFQWYVYIDKFKRRVEKLQQFQKATTYKQETRRKNSF